MKIRKSKKFIASVITVFYFLIQILGVSPVLPLKNAIAAEATVSIPDHQLKGAILEALGRTDNGDITATEMASLKTLTFRGKGIRNLQGLEYATNLVSLGLNENFISDLTPLANLNSLTTLNLQYNQVTDLTPLAGLVNLKQLILYNNLLTNIAPIANLKQLQTLYLSDNPGIKDFSVLSQFTQLKYLWLNGNAITDLAPIANLTQLQILKLERNQISDISSLSNLNLLTELYINENLIQDITPISNLPQLNKLVIYKNKIATFPNLLNMFPLLKELYINDNLLTDIYPLQWLDLTKLNLYNNQIKDISYLQYIPLNYVDVRTNPLDTDASTYLELLRTNNVQVYSDGFEPADPELLIDLYPDTTTLDPAIMIYGTTSLNCTVLVNGERAQMRPFSTPYNTDYFSFSKYVYLKPGENVITITTRDMTNKETTVNVTVYQAVTFQDSGLEEAVRQALNKPTGPITIPDMEGLTSLSVPYKGVSSLKGLEAAVNLQDLNIQGNFITDISPLANLSNLRQLIMEDNQISDLSPLKNLQQLLFLSAERNRITDISPLSSLKQLRLLNLCGQNFADLSPIANLTQLQYLYIDGKILSETDKAVIGQLKYLEGLSIFDSQISDLEFLRGLTYIDTLRLENNQIQDINILLEFPLLKYVYIRNNPLNYTAGDVINTLKSQGVTVYYDPNPIIKDANLVQAIRDTLNKPTGEITYSDLTSLTTLKAIGKGITDLSGLENCINLNTLVLNSNQITDLTPISKLKYLYTLYVADNQVADVTPLKDLTQLMILSLADNKINDITALSNLKNLSNINISNNSITDISIMAGFNQLNDLRLSNNPITNLSSISNLNQLTTLYLEGLSLKDISFVANYPQLKTIILSNNLINNINPLTNLTQLSNVDLKQNPLGLKAESDLQSLISKGIIVEYDPIDAIPPTLTITSPANNYETTVNMVTVTGVAEAGSTVKVRGREVALDTLGNFKADVTLTLGSNLITVLATDVAGNTTREDVTVTYKKPVVDMINNVNVSPNPYNYTAGNMSIIYNLLNDANVTIKVLDSANNVVRVLLNGDAKLAGFNSTYWDGKDAVGNLVAPGTYTYTIDAENLSSEAIQQKGTVVVSKTPVISNVTDSPDPFKADGTNFADISFNLSQKAKVTIKITDNLGNLVKTLAKDMVMESGNQTISWNGTAGENVVDIYPWPTVANGVYTYTIDAIDSIGGFNAIQQKGTITVGKEKSIITNVTLSQNPYNNGSGNLNILYYLLENAKVTIKILDANGKLVKTILNNAQKYAGSNSTSWDGRDALGYKVAGGTYTYTMDAVNSVGISAIQITGTVLVSQNPAISNVSDSPDPFLLDGTTMAKINYNINIPAKVTIGVYNSQGTLVTTLISNESKPAGLNSVEWDGKDSFGIAVKDATYTYKIDAVDELVGYKATQQKGTILVDSNVPTISNVTLSSNPYNNTGSLSIGYTLSEDAYITVKILDSQGNLVRALATNLKKIAGTNSISWDGKDTLGQKVTGTYTYTIDAVDLVGKSAEQKTGTVLVSQLPVISSVSDSPDPFLPDGIAKAKINYNLNIPAKVTIGVYNSSGTLVTTLVNNESKLAGLNSVEWDGKDSFGIVVKDSIYTYKIDAVDELGAFRATQQKGTITVDGNLPTISNVTLSSNPYNNTGSLSIGYTLSEEAYVTFKILDSQGSLVKTIVNNIKKAAGTNSTIWDGRDFNGQKVTGTYTYTIDAVDNVGNQAEQKSGTVLVSQAPVISSVTDSPDPFAADGTNYSTISFNISTKSAVNIKITDKNGNLVKQLLTDETLEAGPQSVKWDGSAGENNIQTIPWPVVDDGVYNYIIDAQEPIAGFKATSYKGTITVEGANPVISNVTYSPKPYLGGSFNIGYQISEDAYITLGIYKENGDLVKTITNNLLKTKGSISAFWDGKDSAGVAVPDGSYYYTIDATDKAGKIAVQHKQAFIKGIFVTID